MEEKVRAIHQDRKQTSRWKI